MNDLQLYFRYIGISIRSQMQYRVSFLLQSAGVFLATAVEFAGVWALFHRFGGLEGWSLPEVAVFYGTISITFAMADALARGFDQFAGMVKSGDFDRLLLRPRSTVLQLIGQELTLRRVGRFAQGAAVLAWGMHEVNAWSPADALLLALTVVGGICLFTGLVIMQAASAFWTIEGLEVWNAFTYGGVFMSEYPVTIYRPWFRKFFTYIIPLACVSYFPAVELLHRSDPLGSRPIFRWLAPTAGVLFLALGLEIWKIGVDHYRSTGS